MSRVYGGGRSSLRPSLSLMGCFDIFVMMKDVETPAESSYNLRDLDVAGVWTRSAK